jgi:hypothetical protein
MLLDHLPFKAIGRGAEMCVVVTTVWPLGINTYETRGVEAQDWAKGSDQL